MKEKEEEDLEPMDSYSMLAPLPDGARVRGMEPNAAHSGASCARSTARRRCRKKMPTAVDNGRRLN